MFGNKNWKKKKESEIKNSKHNGTLNENGP